MGTVAVIADPLQGQGFALAGALVLPAPDADAVRAAWDRLPPDVVLVLLSAAAAEALGEQVLHDSEVPTAVMPP